MVQTVRKYDLEERTASFGESIIKLCRTIKQDNNEKHILDLFHCIIKSLII